MMKKYTIPISIITLFFMLIVIGLFLATSVRQNNNDKPVVYVIVKSINTGPTFEFWETVRKGAEIAAMELNLEMIFDGPDNEIEVDKQIQIVKDAIKKKPTAIVIAATDYKKLSTVAKEVVDNGITLVTIDSALELDFEHSFIGTDNVMAAKSIANELASLLQEKGQVAVLSYVQGTSTAFQREAGFRDSISKYKDIDLIDKTWYCNGSIDVAYEKTLEILQEYPNVTAIFGANETSLIGIARAIDELDAKRKIHVVGFDSNEEIVSKLELGVIDMIIVQKPFNMGYQGVKEAIDINNGEKAPHTVDTGAVIINKDNLYTPENQKLLFPFENKEY
ncbi:MAG: substrate-binding domain-containing protein [Vallitalea sp.]|nr:substrate-binding domain-containing protein [Vallitalea sp.]